MPCLQRLTAFARPYRFGQAPCIVTHLDYETNTVRGIALSGDQVRQGEDCGEAGVRLYWQNLLGGVDTFVFTDGEVRAVETGGESSAVRDGNEFTYDAGVAREVRTLTSQPLDAADMRALLTIAQSNRVWISDADGERTVIVERGSFTYLDSRRRAGRCVITIREGRIQRSQMA